MKFLAKILASIAFAVMPFSALADNFVDQAVEPVVQLNRNCSGVVVKVGDPNITYIVTAQHCVDGEESGFVTIDVKDRAKVVKTTQYVFDIVRQSKNDDLAVIKLREEALRLASANIATEDPVEGEKVWTIGYPLGLTRTITDGYYGGYSDLPKNMRGMPNTPFGNGNPKYRATPPIFGGNSGGGLFKKVGDDFQLVGISDAGFPSFFVAGFYNPQEEINKIVKEAMKHEIDEKNDEEDFYDGWGPRQIRE